MVCWLKIFLRLWSHGFSFWLGPQSSILEHLLQRKSCYANQNFWKQNSSVKMCRKQRNTLVNIYKILNQQGNKLPFLKNLFILIIYTINYK